MSKLTLDKTPSRVNRKASTSDALETRRQARRARQLERETLTREARMRPIDRSALYAREA